MVLILRAYFALVFALVVREKLDVHIFRLKDAEDAEDTDGDSSPSAVPFSNGACKVFSSAASENDRHKPSASESRFLCSKSSSNFD